MEKIYSEEQTLGLTKVGKGTIQFLLNYSKALNISDFKGGQFETILN